LLTGEPADLEYLFALGTLHGLAGKFITQCIRRLALGTLHANRHGRFLLLDLSKLDGSRSGIPT
jgi:hypothetical protein